MSGISAIVRVAESLQIDAFGTKSANAPHSHPCCPAYCGRSLFCSAPMWPLRRCPPMYHSYPITGIAGNRCGYLSLSAPFGPTRLRLLRSVCRHFNESVQRKDLLLCGLFSFGSAYNIFGTLYGTTAQRAGGVV